MNEPILWQPSAEFKAQSNLTAFANWLSEKTDREWKSYHQLWRWTVEHPAEFWEAVAHYFEVQFHKPYQRVLTDDPMPDARWFTGSQLNYAEHIFRQKTDDHPAILFGSERHELVEIGWGELEERVASLSDWLRAQGVGVGDRVVAFLPNIPEATVSFMAACSVGAIWSSCSPDFGVSSVVDRFRQIEPKVLIAADGYQYGGKPFSKMEALAELIEQLPSLHKVVLLPYLDDQADPGRLPKAVAWAETQGRPATLTFEAVPFEHPIWVLYSSGTTGIPKAITHSHGGTLLEHLKYLAFHNDLHPGERFFWYSTTGWMMWNFVQAAALVGGTLVLYDGSPGYPNLNVLWAFAQKAGIHHFGTSAPFLVACMKKEIDLSEEGIALPRLRSIGSTGAPLPPEAFEYVYRHIKEDLWLCSMSGGTDLCTAFVGGCPWEPVYRGEIQCRCLGASLHAFDEAGEPLIGEVGEMVITQPMPSMPVFFWNDPDKQRYRSSYFEHYPHIWRHGDWVRISKEVTLRILGRSDATLNRHGIRIGTAEIYRALHKVDAVKDGLIINLELPNGRHYMPLFVLMQEGAVLSEEVKDQIKRTLRSEYTPRHVPDAIIEVQDIPYTISGKKLEAPVKKILLGRAVHQAANPDAMRNPEALDFFVGFARQIEAEMR